MRHRIALPVTEFSIRPTQKTLRSLDRMLLLRVGAGWILLLLLWRLCA